MFKVFSKTKDVWEAQLQDIRKAKKHIYFEQYILEDFGAGEIGTSYVDALIQKAEAGVEVKLIIDFQGSFDLYSSASLNEKLTKAGVEILYYRTLRLARLINPARFLLRDHRKLLIIDENITWIGGVIVSEGCRGWNDFMVRFDDQSVTRVLNDEFKSQLLRLEDTGSLLAPVKWIDERSHIIGNAPGVGNRFGYDEICHSIMLAQKSVVLVTPYFSPPLKLLRVLNRRLAEGIKIELLIPRQTDNRLADWTREQYLPKLVAKGLTLHYSQQMNHAKVTIVDGSWLSFGSMNLDPLSLIFNHELNITTTKPELIKETEQVVASWRKGLEPVLKNDCEYENLSLVQRFIGKIIKYIIYLTSN